jgi:hypothetical protein
MSTQAYADLLSRGLRVDPRVGGQSKAGRVSSWSGLCMCAVTVCCVTWRCDALTRIPGKGLRRASLTSSSVGPFRTLNPSTLRCPTTARWRTLRCRCAGLAPHPPCGAREARRYISTHGHGHAHAYAGPVLTSVCPLVRSHAQENNAVMAVDLSPSAEKILGIWPLGYKSWRRFAIDASDRCVPRSPVALRDNAAHPPCSRRARPPGFLSSACTTSAKQLAPDLPSFCLTRKPTRLSTSPSHHRLRRAPAATAPPAARASTCAATTTWLACTSPTRSPSYASTAPACC